MGLATDMPTRRRIVSEAKAGKSLKRISEELKVNYTSTRQIYQRYIKSGLSGLVPHYYNCGPQTIKGDYVIYRSSLWLKRLHPDWGAPLIHLILKMRHPDRKISSIRTMQRWFLAAGYNKPRQKKTSRK